MRGWEVCGLLMIRVSLLEIECAIASEGMITRCKALIRDLLDTAGTSHRGGAERSPITWACGFLSEHAKELKGCWYGSERQYLR